MRNLVFVGPPLIITQEELAYGLEIIDGLLREIDKQIG
jgi:hypothetical protein